MVGIWLIGNEKWVDKALNCVGFVLRRESVSLAVFLQMDSSLWMDLPIK